MAQRNPMNDRYQQEQRGKTRKSSASAKPKSTRAATLRDPAPKTKKQKKEERRQRELQNEQKAAAIHGRYEDTADYKKLRRLWWIFLIAAIACTGASVVVNSQTSGFFDENPEGLFWGVFDKGAIGVLSAICMAGAYAFIIAAFYLDLGKIRKERKQYNATMSNNNSKEARKNQKRAAAEQRAKAREEAQRKAEEEKAAAATPEEGQAATAKGSMRWLRRSKAEAKEAKEQLEEKAAAEKERLGADAGSEVDAVSGASNCPAAAAGSGASNCPAAAAVSGANEEPKVRKGK